MKILLLATLLIILPTFSSAESLKLNKGDLKLEGVALASGADWGTTHLGRIGSGLRYKKVVFVKAKVYVGQLFSDQAEKFKRSEEALDSLRSMKIIAMHLTFLRAVDAAKITEAFKEGLKENGVSPDDADAKKFLAAAAGGGDGKDHSEILVVAERLPAGERITYSGPNGNVTVVEGQEGLIKKIFSLWFGKTTDSGLESFKKEILAGS